VALTAVNDRGTNPDGIDVSVGTVVEGLEDVVVTDFDVDVGDLEGFDADEWVDPLQPATSPEASRMAPPNFSAVRDLLMIPIFRLPVR
jgi:hypothetical protein